MSNFVVLGLDLTFERFSFLVSAGVKGADESADKRKAVRGRLANY
jgi:hypothetical protein